MHGTWNVMMSQDCQ